MPRPRKYATTAEMYRVARLFYNEGKSKKEIASELKMDGRDVRRILEDCIMQGVVKIHIDEAPEMELQQRIREKYHLQRVLIAPGQKVETAEDCDELFRRFGTLAAEYFEELFDNHPRQLPLHVGLSGGARLLEFVSAVPIRTRHNVYIHVVALVGTGRTANATSHVAPSVTASILWTRTGALPGHCEYETVEPYRIDKEPGPRAREIIGDALARLEQIPSIEATINDMSKLDVVFAGFGFIDEPGAAQAIKNRITLGSLLAAAATPKELANEHFVGDFCYCPYRANGSQSDKWRFYLSAGHYTEHRGIDFYKQMVASGKKVVGFGGPHLAVAIKAALKARIINVLIIDDFTARQIADGK